MLSVGNRVVAASLCALLSTSPLVGYASEAQKADNAVAKMEEVFKEGEDAEFQGKKVPYSLQGTYTLTLGEGDFLKLDKGEASDAKTGKNKDEKAAAETKALEEEKAAADAKVREEKAAADAKALEEEKAAADAKALEDAKSALEGAKSARDEAQRALDARTEDEKVAETEKAKAETQKTEAEKQAQDVETQKAEAEKKAKEAETQKAEADKKAQEAENLKAEAEKKAQEAENQKAEAEKQAQEAGGEMEAQDAEAQNAGGEMESKEAEGQSAAADEAKQSAEDAAKAVQEKAEAHDNAVKARKQAEEELSKAEEAVKVAEQKVAELERGAAQADASSSEARKENKSESKAENKAENKDENKAENKDENKAEGKAEKKDESKAGGKDENKAEGKKAFADVRLEDVKVYYEVLANRAELEADESGNVEPRFEEREARVNALANDNGAITLSFTDPDAASNATEYYYVEIEALGKYAPVMAESARPQLSAESDVKADSESCDVTIRAEGAKFADGLNAADLRLGGSFEDMQVTGAEASGDTLVVHLSGTPKMDYDVASVVTDGQVIVPASGFEGSTAGATAIVDVALSDEAYDVGDEDLPAAVTTGEAESSSVEGDTGRATVYLDAELGEFKDVGPESITLGDTFSGGKVESVTKEGERLKVELTFPVDGEQVGDRLLAGTVKLAAGAMEDAHGDDAPEIETLVALAPAKAGDKKDDKKSEEDKKKAEEEKKKEKEENSKTLKTYSDGFKYAGDKLKKVDPTVAELAKFYGEVFSLASNAAGGKYLDALKNVESLLQICGVIEPDAKEVTAADVLEEVKALRMVIEAVDRKIDENTEESRADRYTATAIRLARIRARCTSVQTMFQEGAKILANRKDNPMKPPAKGASKEQMIDYNAELRRVILQEGAKTDVGKDKGKAPTFFDAKNTMVKLNEELFTVANWVSIDKNAVNSSANPINVFDKLVAMRFNWDSEGYYARLAFRTELKCTILSAFSYLAVFYNYEVPLMNKQQKPLIDKVADALKQIDARPAGVSPEQVRESNGKNKAFKLYSPTLGITIKRSRKVWGGKPVGDKSVEDVPDGKTHVYYAKAMSQGGLWNDLQLAGLEVDNDQSFHGIGFNFIHECKERMWKTDRYLDQREGWKTRKTWTTILFKGKNMAEKVWTSEEKWELFQNNGPRKETKVKDNWQYNFYWFDRA